MDRRPTAVRNAERETVILPASGHYDSDGDSLSVTARKNGRSPHRLETESELSLQTESGEKSLSSAVLI